MAKTTDRMRAALFGVLWEAYDANRTMRGSTATLEARRRVEGRGHHVGKFTAAGLLALHRDGSLDVVAGSVTALLDAEVTLTANAVETARARAARNATRDTDVAPCVTLDLNTQPPTKGNS